MNEEVKNVFFLGNMILFRSALKLSGYLGLIYTHSTLK